MKIEKGKIVEATESELLDYYLKRELDTVMSFADFKGRMKDAGVKIRKPTRRRTCASCCRNGHGRSNMRTWQDIKHDLCNVHYALHRSGQDGLAKPLQLLIEEIQEKLTKIGEAIPVELKKQNGDLFF